MNPENLRRMTPAAVIAVMVVLAVGSRPVSGRAALLVAAVVVFATGRPVESAGSA
jgi:hypothetical protein